MEKGGKTMITLTKEQKISNYQEILENLKAKKENISAQIRGIENKISKLQSEKEVSFSTLQDSKLFSDN